MFYCFISLNLSFTEFLAKNFQHNWGNFRVECLSMSTNGHQHHNFILLWTQSGCCCGQIKYIHTYYKLAYYLHWPPLRHPWQETEQAYSLARNLQGPASISFQLLFRSSGISQNCNICRKGDINLAKGTLIIYKKSVTTCKFMNATTPASKLKFPDIPVVF